MYRTNANAFDENVRCTITPVLAQRYPGMSVRMAAVVHSLAGARACSSMRMELNSASVGRHVAIRGRPPTSNATTSCRRSHLDYWYCQRLFVIRSRLAEKPAETRRIASRFFLSTNESAGLAGSSHGSSSLCRS